MIKLDDVGDHLSILGHHAMSNLCLLSILVHCQLQLRNTEKQKKIGATYISSYHCTTCQTVLSGAWPLWVDCSHWRGCQAGRQRRQSRTFEKCQKEGKLPNAPGEGKPLCVEILCQSFLTLDQTVLQVLKCFWKTLNIGRLHHVWCLRHLNHHVLELFVHAVKPLDIFRKLNPDIFRPHED